MSIVYWHAQFLHHAGAYEALACEAFRHGVAGAAKRAATDAAQQGMTVRPL